MPHHPIPHMAEVAQQARVAVATLPNGSARQLRGVRGGLIGMLATDLKDNFQLKIAQHVEAAASAAGRMILQCQTLGAVGREVAHLESFHEMGAEGVVVVSLGDVTTQLLRMEAAGIVSVVVNSKTPTPFRPSELTTRPGAILLGTIWPTRVVAALPSSAQAWDAAKCGGGWQGRHLPQARAAPI